MNSWLPWRFLLGRAARRRGFVDPFAILARLRRFSQPSEVQEPIELIRAGVLFHARGLINTKVLQNNLDWIWPYWISRQFDPKDPSFLPRAFSFTHVNLTHRNWTAVGVPGLAVYPIVDPRGLVTPAEDGWSLDWWLVPDTGPPLYPSLSYTANQRLELVSGPEVVTLTSGSSAELETRVRADLVGEGAELHLRAKVTSARSGWLVLAVRPVNPEGVSFIDELRFEPAGLRVNGSVPLRLEPAPDRWAHSTYPQGDVASHLLTDETSSALPTVVHCKAGLATAAALFRVEAGKPRVAEVRWTLPRGAADAPTWKSRRHEPVTVPLLPWDRALEAVPRLVIPETHWQFLHEAAVHTLILLSPGEIYAGPYTYRRFWFRDACLILNALLALNQPARARRTLEDFPRRQRADGYFHSQEGEWDANGQVLWIADRWERLSGELLPMELTKPLHRGAEWIVRKRATTRGERHTGLLPSGFSAEHLGPNDFYYWDDFWGVAGLHAASALLARRGDPVGAARWAEEAAAFAADVERSLVALPSHVASRGMPASPYRRMDSGAIGSMVADYPLRLDAFGRHRFLATADWLWRRCLHRGGFFQDMIHSGVNAYLTLALAQTFLRASDPRYLGLVQAVASAASPTGQWPEGVHPITGGGCMGDGQHAWAAAEWVLMMRAFFLREEDDHLVIGAGLPTEWTQQPGALSYGPSPTAWGPAMVELRHESGDWHCRVQGAWHGRAPRLRIAVPGFEEQWRIADDSSCRLVAVSGIPQKTPVP